MPARSVAVTSNAAPVAKSTGPSEEFPAAITTAAPASQARFKASATIEEVRRPGSIDRLMMSAWWATAQSIEAARSDGSAEARQSAALHLDTAALTEMRRARGATPAEPSPLSARAAIRPATWVPCPSGSDPPARHLLRSPPVSRQVARSST